jgi:hypothetical protein
MASTSDELQAELTLERGIISRDETIDATYRMVYVTSGAGGPQAGKSCWCRTTIGNSTADQVAEIIAALTTPGPVDENVA